MFYLFLSFLISFLLFFCLLIEPSINNIFSILKTFGLVDNSLKPIVNNFQFQVSAYAPFLFGFIFGWFFLNNFSAWGQRKTLKKILLKQERVNDISFSKCYFIHSLGDSIFVLSLIYLSQHFLSTPLRFEILIATLLLFILIVKLLLTKTLFKISFFNSLWTLKSQFISAIIIILGYYSYFYYI